MGKRFLLTGVIVTATLLLFAYGLPSSHVFADDFTRDLYDILGITRGKLTLLGPAVSFGGLRTGPYYYYLFAPVFFLTRANISAVLYFNAGLFAVALGFFFYQLQGRVGTTRALLAAAVTALVPVYLSAARNPSNAFTYLALLLVFLSAVIRPISRISQIGVKSRRIRIFLLGVLGGIIANFHFVTLPLFFLLFLVILLRLSRKRNVTFLVLGFAVTLLPLLFFEVRHNFVMLKTTLQTSSAFLENRNLGNLPDSVLPDKYIPNNFFILLAQVKKWLTIEPIVLVVLGSVLVFLQRKRTVTLTLFACSLVSLFLMAILLRGQFSPHYLVAYAFVLFFSVVVLLSETRLGVLVLLVVVGVEVLAFPGQDYEPSVWTPERFERPVAFAITHNLVDRATPFNVLRVVQRPNPTTLGYEYRYFLRLKGYEPNAISDYANAKTLLVFSDVPDLDFGHLSSWEIDQFGRQSLGRAQKFSLGSLTIYKLGK